MIVTDGFEEVEAIATAAILRRAGVYVDIYSIHGTSATGRYNIEINNLGKFNELALNTYSCLIIPGGPQYKDLMGNVFFLNVIKYFDSRNRYICAICAAPTILGKLGLLKGKKYTCFKSMNEDFGGTYVEDYVVQDGKIITAISAAASIDFAFKIVENLKGKEFAEEVKNSIYYYSKK